MKFSTTLYLAAAGLVAAAPSSIFTPLKARTATFDDITVVDTGLSLQPIGAYDGLEWASFDVINIGAGVTGVKAQSSPNVALLYVASGGLTETGTLETTGNTLYFALQSFYFGCVLSTEESLASAPTTCSITVTGSRSGKTVAGPESFTFTPDNALLADMEKVSFNGAWAAVDQVTITNTGALATAQGVLFDNVKYITYSS